jgi:homogentisate 1,2-dioxygenase
VRLVCVAEAVLLLLPNSILRHSRSNISPLKLILYLPATMTLSFSASASASFTSPPTSEESYAYQVGFGNLLASEAVPGALPEGGRNVPQRCPYDLYSEHLSGTSFISSRATVQNVWMYRIRPSVAHHPLEPLEYNSHLEACFSPQNSNVKFTPLTYTWGPLEIPSDVEKVNFVQGMKTMGGNGDPTQKEGTAVHLYATNASMANQAFCNNDGDFLIIPQLGRLDIQTEMGRMMVRPGEICVIQAGIRFKVSLPDGTARGCKCPKFLYD